jgi:hypothetical protein
MRRHRTAVEAAVILLLLLVAAASSLRHWYEPVAWTNDGLFYAAQMLEVRGSSQGEALHVVFDGPTARALRQEERETLPRPERRVSDPHWVEYSAKFYRRRWFVPTIAAGLYPWLGFRAVEVVSLVGYLVAGLFLYLLLRRSFRIGIAAGVAAVCLLLPAFRHWSFFPLTDSWGVALVAGCLVFAVLTLERSLGFLPLWVISVGALSVTRDAGLVVVAAVGWLLLRGPTMRRGLLFATGIAASLPALLLAGTPLRTQLAWEFSGYHVPRSTSWSFVAHHYASAVHDIVVLDLQRHLPMVLLFLVALVPLFERKADQYRRLIRASAVFAIAYLAVAPAYTDFRLELVLLPMVAVGLALLLERGGAELKRIGRAPPSN